MLCFVLFACYHYNCYNNYILFIANFCQWSYKNTITIVVVAIITIMHRSMLRWIVERRNKSVEKSVNIINTNVLGVELCDPQGKSRNRLSCKRKPNWKTIKATYKCGLCVQVDDNWAHGAFNWPPLLLPPIDIFSTIYLQIYWTFSLFMHNISVKFLHFDIIEYQSYAPLSHNCRTWHHAQLMNPIDPWPIET